MNLNNPLRRLWLAMLLVAFASGFVQSVSAFQHPGIPLTMADLDNLMSNLNISPWSAGYSALTSDYHSQLSYTMQGPFGYVNRNQGSNYDNENQWKNDMQAVFNLARLWYFTGNTNYVQKSHDILIAWANTMTNFGGAEADLDLGDYAYRYGGGGHADGIEFFPNGFPRRRPIVLGLPSRHQPLLKVTIMVGIVRGDIFKKLQHSRK